MIRPHALDSPDDDTQCITYVYHNCRPCLKPRFVCRRHYSDRMNNDCFWHEDSVGDVFLRSFTHIDWLMSDEPGTTLGLMTDAQTPFCLINHKRITFPTQITFTLQLSFILLGNVTSTPLSGRYSEDDAFLAILLRTIRCYERMTHVPSFISPFCRP